MATITLEQVVERIFAFRQITPLDQHLLKTILTHRPQLSQQQHTLLQKLCDALQKGLLWVPE